MKTDNSHFEEKVQLRLECLPVKKNITVLDCYSGTGSIWSEVKQLAKNKIVVVGIEKEKSKNNLALLGDNRKYLNILDLSKYDIIDLDAYGIPFQQLEILFKKKYKGTIVVTAIQRGMGTLPKGMLIKLGYSKKMVEKIPTLFNRNGIDKLKNYLYLYGVKQVTGYFLYRTNYFYFTLT